MNSAIERLLTLRVRDIMNCDVVTIQQDQTMSDAAAVLRLHDVTGAPVVDSVGRCVGVLSNSDFALREKERSEREEHAAGGWLHRETDMPNTSIQIEAFRDDCVREHMSPILQTIPADATVLNAGRVMCGEHIHRIVIVDESGRPVGVVSSLDVVATMVAAVEE